MKLIPKYAENIIVGTICNDNFSWYVTEKDCWFLDLFALKEAYKRKGYIIDISNPLDIRNGFPVLNKQSFIQFESKIREYSYVSPDLHEILLMLRDDYPDSWIYEMRPSLLIDFDNQILYNYYYEPLAFEEYVPDSWKGTYQEILPHIPVSERYWITSEGENLFRDSIRRVSNEQ